MSRETPAPVLIVTVTGTDWTDVEVADPTELTLGVHPIGMLEVGTGVVLGEIVAKVQLMGMETPAGSVKLKLKSDVAPEGSVTGVVVKKLTFTVNGSVVI